MAATLRRATRHAAPLTLASMLLAATLIPNAPLARSLTVAALAPVEEVASGFHDAVAVAADAAGALYISDGAAGTITRIDPDGRLRVIVRGLRKPAGLAFDPTGRLLIAEEGRGRVLARDPAGALGVVASGIKKPRWVAVDEDGTLYVAAKALRAEPARDDDRDGDDDEDDSRGDVIVRVGPGSGPALFVDGFKGLQSLALHAGSLYALARRLSGAGEPARATVVRIGIGPNGQAATVETLVRANAHHPVGLVVDGLGAVFLTARRLHPDEGRSGIILKRLFDGRLETFASGLRDPRGLVLEAPGHLLAVDADGGQRPGGRLLRFRAPASPVLQAPAFSNRSPVAVPGTAEVRSQVSAYRVGEPGPALATTTAEARRRHSARISRSCPRFFPHSGAASRTSGSWPSEAILRNTSC